MDLTQEDLRALEQTRRGLHALSNNIASLKQEILRANPLPPWTSLQTSATILSNNFHGLTTHLSRHSDLLNTTVVYPSTNYPGRVHEPVLNTLLRKKLEPPIASWVDEGREMATNTKDTSTNEIERAEYSDWARDFIGQRVQKYALEEAGDNYTMEERELGVENVNTGLKRKFDEDESDDEENEDMEEAGATRAETSPEVSGQAEFGLGKLKLTSKPKSRSGIAAWTFSSMGMAIEPHPTRR